MSDSITSIVMPITSKFQIKQVVSSLWWLTSTAQRRIGMCY